MKAREVKIYKEGKKWVAIYNGLTTVKYKLFGQMMSAIDRFFLELP